MAGSMTDAFEKKVLDLIFRNTGASATAPMGLDATNVWIGLFTAAPTDSTAGTEVSGGAYARVAVVRTGAGFAASTVSPAGAPATTSNSGAITFPTASASWGTVVAFGIFDAATVGTLIYWGDLTATKAVGSGDTASFAAGALTITQD
jgi:hypothetical protein